MGGRTLQEWEENEDGKKTRSIREGVPEGEKPRFGGNLI